MTTQRTRLLDLYLDGRLERAAFDARERPLAAEEQRLQRQFDQARARLAAGQADADRHAAALRYCRLIARGLDRLDEGGRQELIRRVFTRIVAYADRLEVHGALPITAAPRTPPDPPAQRSGRRCRSAGASFRVSGDCAQFSTLPIHLVTPFAGPA